MANQRLSQDKRALVLSALCEGTPINAVCRMFGVAKETVLRIIEETGAALGDYMHKNVREQPVARVEMDEQWQYVGEHGQRMNDEKKKANPNKGDFWLWAAIDADTKLVFSFIVGRRTWQVGEDFVADVSKRVVGGCQIATDNHRAYAGMIRAYFGYEAKEFSYGTETKVFGEPNNWNPTDWQLRRKNGVAKVAKCTRVAVHGSPNLGSLTTSHVERVFLTVRQEVARFGRLSLAYSKNLRMHKAAVAMSLGIYNLVRKHKGIDGLTPAQAAGVEEKRWTLLDVVEMTDAYWQPIYAARAEKAAAAKRIADDEIFLKALATMDEGGMNF
jgi:IS1 family transposase